MKVLIVEDEALECKAMVHLVQTGFSEAPEVMTARDGETAVKLALEGRPDLILMDINLPLLDGLAASRQIRKELPDSKIIMVSAYSDYEHLRESMRAQALDYIVKPYSVETFREAVDRAVKDSREEEALYGKAGTIQKIKKYLEQHYTENITLQDVADEICLDKSYLGRLFKEECQTTIMGYLREVRLTKAKELLLRGMNSSEVAEKTGFGDAAYFAKSFRQSTGISPARYRENVGKEVTDHVSSHHCTGELGGQDGNGQ